MHQSMRREDRGITDEDALAVLDRAQYGMLSTVSADGTPYGVPLGFCRDGDRIYFHCALTGRKLDNIAHDSRVSFCVVGRTELLPEQFAMNYQSVIVEGRAAEVAGDERMRALMGLLRKYSPEHLEAGGRYIATAGAKTRVYAIAIDGLCGKSRQ